jgi:hypothetical protein
MRHLPVFLSKQRRNHYRPQRKSGLRSQCTILQNQQSKRQKLIGEAVLLEPEPAATNQIGPESARYEAVIKGYFGFFENSNPNYGCEGSKIFYISETISFENVTQRDSFEISNPYASVTEPTDSL